MGEHAHLRPLVLTSWGRNSAYRLARREEREGRACTDRVGVHDEGRIHAVQSPARWDHGTRCQRLTQGGTHLLLGQRRTKRSSLAAHVQ